MNNLIQYFQYFLIKVIEKKKHFTEPTLHCLRRVEWKYEIIIDKGTWQMKDLKYNLNFWHEHLKIMRKICLEWKFRNYVIYVMWILLHHRKPLQMTLPLPTSTMLLPSLSLVSIRRIRIFTSCHSNFEFRRTRGYSTCSWKI